MECHVRFKEGLDPDDYLRLDDRVKRAFEWLVYTLDCLGYDAEVFAMFLKGIKDHGGHGDGRALDCIVVRRKDAEFNLPFSYCQRIAAFMTLLFRYPGTNPVCRYIDDGRGKHFHLEVPAEGQFQVHPPTFPPAA